MKTKSLSIKLIYFFIITSTIISSIIFNISILNLTKNSQIITLTVSFSCIFFLIILLLIFLLRIKIISFSKEINNSLDSLINSDTNNLLNSDEELLVSKINYKLKRTHDILIEGKNKTIKDKESIQEIIADISHQVKTPISNLKIINSMFLENNLPKEKEIEFLNAMNMQLNKLEFLFDSMIKSSRLETGIISIKLEKAPIYDTIANALGEVVFLAEEKNINIDVNCDSKIKINHSKKWTIEALFNILDNAVKYTPENGKIEISVFDGEMYLKIDIKDNGKGIDESYHGKIFKRFFREEEVFDIDGVGVGLYLSRKIIMAQNGYIKVDSEIGKGSTFSIYLLNN